MYKMDKNNQFFNEFQFVIEAKSSNKSGGPYFYFWVQDYEGERIFICTDKYRLHIAKVNTDLEIGSYKVIKVKREYLLEKGDGGAFPDFSKIMPKNKETLKQIVSVYDDIKHSTNYVMAKIIRSYTVNYINYNFVNDVLKHLKPRFYFGEHENAPIYFKKEHYEGLIIPILGE